MTSKSEKYLNRIRSVVRNAGVKSIVDSDNVLRKFIIQYGHLKKFGLKINGIADLGLNSLVIDVSTPLIFDKRLIPKIYMGFGVRSGISEIDLPDEFKNLDADKEYIWAYQRFENFVDHNLHEIRLKLDNPSLTRDEALDALCFGDFTGHKENCMAWAKEGKIPNSPVLHS